MFGLDVTAFVDRDKRKQQTGLYGRRVLSIDELKNMDDEANIAIVITAFSMEEISKDLDTLGIGAGHTFTTTGFLTSFLSHDNVRKLREFAEAHGGDIYLEALLRKA